MSRQLPSKANSSRTVFQTISSIGEPSRRTPTLGSTGAKRAPDHEEPLWPRRLPRRIVRRVSLLSLLGDSHEYALIRTDDLERAVGLLTDLAAPKRNVVARHLQAHLDDVPVAVLHDAHAFDQPDGQLRQ